MEERINIMIYLQLTTRAWLHWNNTTKEASTLFNSRTTPTLHHITWLLQF